MCHIAFCLSTEARCSLADPVPCVSPHLQDLPWKVAPGSPQWVPQALCPFLSCFLLSPVSLPVRAPGAVIGTCPLKTTTHGGSGTSGRAGPQIHYSHPKPQFPVSLFCLSSQSLIVPGTSRCLMNVLGELVEKGPNGEPVRREE